MSRPAAPKAHSTAAQSAKGSPVRRVVIADAGPLIGLARIDRLDLLQGLFGQVTVTTPIAKELLAGGPFPDTQILRNALSRPWLPTVDLDDLLPGSGQALCRDWMHLHQIDIGEASAMVLAQHLAGQGVSVLLVMDDFRGRSAAQHARMPLIGVAGLLLLAKQAGLIGAVKPLLLNLHQGGYFLSARLIEASLRQAGEIA